MPEHMPPLTRNLNEIDERFDNYKDTKVNILVDLNETFLYIYIVKVCIAQSSAHPAIPSAQQHIS